MGVSQLEKGLSEAAPKACQGTKRRVVLRRPKRIAMKRNRSQDRTRSSGPRRSYGIVRRVRTLKRLVPSAKKESQGLDGLFTDTAEYILSLQMRVRVMQIMVQVLSSGSQK